MAMYLGKLSVEGHVHLKLRDVVIQMWLLMVPHVTKPHEAARIL
jgi:hypothetical protein